MYRYIIDIRYPKGIECEDPCTVHNRMQTMSKRHTWLVDNYTRTEMLVEFETIQEADAFAIKLKELKEELSADCTIDCYVVTSKWSV